MKNESLSRTYARALLELAESHLILERVSEEVELFRKLLREDRKIRVFFESPGLEEKERRGTFEAALRGRVSDVLISFLEVVVHKRREQLLLDMLDRFRELHDMRIGLVRAEVTTAVPVSAESLEALRSRLEADLKKRVVLENTVNEEVLGGLVLRFEGKVADGSLRTALKEMEAPVRKIKLGSEFVHEDSP